MRRIRRMRPGDALYATAVLVATAALAAGLPLTGHLREPREDHLPVTLANVAIFLVFNALWIGVPAALHAGAVRDYAPIRSVWVFSVWGGLTGALLGEIAIGRSPVMIIPYTILMVIYAHLYKRFSWWKVATTTYLAGMLIENVMNRSAMQAPTLMWVGLFIAPYFVAKIVENRRMLAVRAMLRAAIRPAMLGTGLSALAWVATRENPSPPLIFLGVVLPLAVTGVRRTFRRGDQRISGGISSRSRP